MPYLTTPLDADQFWVRIAVTIAVGIGCAIFGKERIPQADSPRKPASTRPRSDAGCLLLAVTDSPRSP